jgi:hypothetical protein
LVQYDGCDRLGRREARLWAVTVAVPPTVTQFTSFAVLFPQLSAELTTFAPPGFGPVLGGMALAGDVGRRVTSDGRLTEPTA